MRKFLTKTIEILGIALLTADFVSQSMKKAEEGRKTEEENKEETK
jgi:hypothetical protein